MNHAVKLVGLDFGTTTSSAVIASAQVVRNSVTGRMELSQVRECYRSDIVFTPFHDDSLDEERVREYLDGWLAAGGVHPEEIFGGGALLTGLAAQASNSAALVRLIRRRLREALIATANDPCLEAWLAFMGSCTGLTRAHPDTPIVNLDIGGGTTNLALGVNGEVLRTGCLFVGARHIQVVPGTYRIVKLSRYARPLLDQLGIGKGPGDSLTMEEVEHVLGFYVRLLEGAVAGTPHPVDDPVGGLHQLVAFRLLPEMPHAVVTLSGGVGELVYAHLAGKPPPPTTAYGDLGIDLARRLVNVPRWATHLRTYVPASAGRATVYGLLRHSTQISGSTVFLPRQEALPLVDLPIVGTVLPASSDLRLRDLVELIQRSPKGGCLRAMLAGPSWQVVRELGQRIARVLRAQGFPPTHPLVLLVPEDCGKLLGHYITEWGALPLNLVVIDEIAVRDAHFAHVGALQNQVVPVSFYGISAGGEVT
jgi:ethanolamine utilization protein EutA